MKPGAGDVFNPSRKACGFYPPDVYSASREDGDGPKRLYERLVRWAGTQGYCWPSVKAMAAALGKGERQVRSDLAVLVSRGLIYVQRRGSEAGGRAPNAYYFRQHPMFDSYRQDTAANLEESNRQDTAAKVGELPAGFGEVSGSFPLGNRQDTAIAYKDELRKELRKELSNTSSAPSVRERNGSSQRKKETEQWFAKEFWPTYPRKKGKTAALAIALKVAKSSENCDAIIEGLKRQLPELQSKDPQYIPYPATWLKQRRWEDEPEEPTQALTVRGQFLTTSERNAQIRDAMFRDLMASRFRQ